ncbi:MAG: DNA integrity scanning protein DisA nucleotide-binding domain protein [Thermoplasmatota archaeon]
MDTTSALLEAAQELAAKANTNVLLLVSDRRDLIEDATKRIPLPFLVATSKPELRKDFRDRARALIPLSDSPHGSFGILGALKEMLLAAVLDGSITAADRVLVLASNVDHLDLIIAFDVARDLELTHLRGELEGRVAIPVIERVMNIANDLAREGREGKPVGTVFVVGDTERVLAHSRQAVINPFKGYPETERSILDESLLETVKEFAQVDGAFLVRADGVLEAAGRYLDIDQNIELTSGLGGRHLAAASISRRTRAIAVVVSSNGSIRVFKDGREIVIVGKL